MTATAAPHDPYPIEPCRWADVDIDSAAIPFDPFTPDTEDQS
jgi:hypothetical protein